MASTSYAIVPGQGQCGISSTWLVADHANALARHTLQCDMGAQLADEELHVLGPRDDGSSATSPIEKHAMSLLLGFDHDYPVPA